MFLKYLIICVLVILITIVPNNIKIDKYINLDHKTISLIAFGICLVISVFDFIIGAMCAVLVGVILLNFNNDSLEHFDTNVDENLVGFKNMINAATTVDQACKVSDIYCKEPVVLTPPPITETIPTIPTSPQFVDDKPVVIQDETMEAFDTNTDDEEEDLNEGFVGKQVRELFTKDTHDSGADYDMVGCRYDLNGNLKNVFLQGPPVALCDNYNQIEIDKIGGAFYPINP